MKDGRERMFFEVPEEEMSMLRHICLSKSKEQTYDSKNTKSQTGIRIIGHG